MKHEKPALPVQVQAKPEHHFSRFMNNLAGGVSTYREMQSIAIQLISVSPSGLCCGGELSSIKNM